LILEIPQNPLLYKRDNFVNFTVIDLSSTDLVKLPTDPEVEQGLLPHMVMELHFMRFQNSCKLGPSDWKCWWTYVLSHPGSMEELLRKG